MFPVSYVLGFIYNPSIADYITREWECHWSGCGTLLRSNSHPHFVNSVRKLEKMQQGSNEMKQHNEFCHSLALNKSRHIFRIVWRREKLNLKKIRKKNPITFYFGFNHSNINIWKGKKMEIFSVHCYCSGPVQDPRK